MDNSDKRSPDLVERFSEDMKNMTPLSRRRFLALLSASAAFTAASCTNYKDKGDIVPYTRKSEEIVPGIANYYASTCGSCSQSCGILVTAREGRPIKVDGNPEHPVNQGKICTEGQASVLNLYDPSRLRTPVKRSGANTSELSWNEADNRLYQAITSGREVAIVAHPVYSMTERKLFDELQARYNNIIVYFYELTERGYGRSALQKSFGLAELPTIRFDMAKVILALESDFLGSEDQSLVHSRLYAAGRNVMDTKDASRLYAVEGTLSVTGMSADYRLRLRPDAQYEFVNLLISQLQVGKNQNALSEGLTSFAKKHGLKEKVLSSMLNDLSANYGKAIVLTGHTMPESMHLAVNRLNSLIGAGALMSRRYAVTSGTALSSKEDIEGLISRMNAGQIAAVLHYDSNPVYHLATDYGYRAALKKVPLKVSLTEAENETSMSCDIVMPLSHPLESWGDGAVLNGLYSLRQPVIYNIFNTRQREAVLLTLLNEGKYRENDFVDYLRANWQATVFPLKGGTGDFNTFWHQSLHDGFVDTTTEGNETATLSINANAQAGNNTPQSTDGYCLQLKNNHFLGDGRYVNNGWLQEIPHPVSKIVWDNYAAISKKTARDLKVKNGDMISVSTGGKPVKLPVFIQPGTADKTIVVELGYGRWNAGEVGSNVGVNAGLLMKKDGQFSHLVYNNIKVAKADGHYELVATQEQHSPDDDFESDAHLRRGIIREGTVAEFKADEHFMPKEDRKKQSVNEDIRFDEVKWGMGIDLNKCIGCGACIIACDIENNVPVVGKEQVKAGREMHWLRLDRYYTGTEEDPKASLQPMLCQHCDTAPCENVCPVAATTHSFDGLNQMAYNRCVGTRYCSNNCPYKVRRFNFFNFRDEFAGGYYENELTELVRNPEVTVRSRGVMEKCTFCIQRIMQARENAREQGRPVRGEDVTTACAQACPTNAIVFGDLNDKNSEVSRYHKDPLSYYVLAELNTRPNIAYVARLRNTDKEEMAAFEKYRNKQEAKENMDAEHKEKLKNNP